MPDYPRWPDSTSFDLDTYVAGASSMWERLLRRFNYLHRVGHPDGLAPLDADGLVPAVHLPASGGGGAVASVNGQTGAVILDAADVDAVPASAVGVASGVASLGADGKVPSAQLPPSSGTAVTATRVAASASTTINSTTATDITGLTQTLTVPDTAATYVVHMTMDIASASGQVFLGELYVDGVVQTGQIIYIAAGGARACLSQTWLITGVAAGSRIFKGRGRLNAASGSMTVAANHSTLTILKVA